MKITPSGTRTWRTSSPLGRRLDAIVSPIGSGRAATSRSAWAISSTRLGSSRRRSIAAGPRPRPGAAATSAALAARTSSRRSTIAEADRFSQASLAAPPATASFRDATLRLLGQVEAQARRDDRTGFDLSPTSTATLVLMRMSLPQPRTAPQTLIASTVAATSWTLTTRAPATHAASAETAEAVARSASPRPVIVPRNPLRDVPIRTAHPSVANRSRFRKISRLCAIVLPNPIPGSTAIRSRGMPRLGPLHPTGQEVVDLADDVLVSRVVLHGPGDALHVHEHDPGAGLGDDPGHLGVAPHRGDVVDDRGAGGQGAAGDLGLGRVDGDRHAGLGGQRLDHRQHPAQLLLDRDGLRAGPAGLAAEVEQVGPLGGQAAGVVDGALGAAEAAAVGEAVGRHVHDAHHLRARDRRRTGSSAPRLPNAS